jgi:CBS domain containing-hemolysin-like protein
MGSALAPLIRFYQFLLYPVAKPTALVVDWWLREEGIRYYRERDLKTVIRKHIEASESEIDRLEGIGAMNFLSLDPHRLSSFNVFCTTLSAYSCSL